MLVAFFTCIGLNASRDVLRRGGGQVLLFLGIGTALAVLQNVVGVGVAALLGADPLLGLVSGSISMTGGHGTALGFAPVLEQQGLAGAGPLGAAAATLGLVAGGLLGGPVGIWRRALPATLASCGISQPCVPAAGLSSGTCCWCSPASRRVPGSAISWS
jgi:ESS family glutamate:Na+ symporter